MILICRLLPSDPVSGPYSVPLDCEVTVGLARPVVLVGLGFGYLVVSERGGLACWLSRVRLEVMQGACQVSVKAAKQAKMG